MVADISVQDQLKKMVDLQKIDGEIYELNKQLEEKPAALEALKEQFESKKARLNDLEAQDKAIQMKRKEFELEMQGKEQEITKANNDLNQLKTNKEYQAKIAEIESMKADKSRIEESIINSYDESDKVSGEVEEEKKNVAEEEKGYLAKKKEVEDEVKVIQDRVAVLEGQRKQALTEVDQTYLPLYEKLIKHKQGLAIVPVHGNSCGGCYMNVTPQIINAIKMKQDLVQCEMCNRILYIEDEL